VEVVVPQAAVASFGHEILLEDGAPVGARLYTARPPFRFVRVLTES
jgi:hypothetical protein